MTSEPFDPHALPPGWEERDVDTGRPVARYEGDTEVKVRSYYFNTVSGHSQWQFPRFPADRLPDGWEKRFDENDDAYYVHAALGLSQWEWPADNDVTKAVQTQVDLQKEKDKRSLQAMSEFVAAERERMIARAEGRDEGVLARKEQASRESVQESWKQKRKPIAQIKAEREARMQGLEASKAAKKEDDAKRGLTGESPKKFEYSEWQEEEKKPAIWEEPPKEAEVQAEWVEEEKPVPVMPWVEGNTAAGSPGSPSAGSAVAASPAASPSAGSAAGSVAGSRASGARAAPPPPPTELPAGDADAEAAAAKVEKEEGHQAGPLSGGGSSGGKERKSEGRSEGSRVQLARE